MGENPFTHYQYANREFLLNAMEYLVGNAGILETRAKDYTLRLLDKRKIDEEKSFWTGLNFFGPIGLIVLFGLIFSSVNKWRFRKIN